MLLTFWVMKFQSRSVARLASWHFTLGPQYQTGTSLTRFARSHVLANRGVDLQARGERLLAELAAKPPDAQAAAVWHAIDCASAGRSAEGHSFAKPELMAFWRAGQTIGVRLVAELAANGIFVNGLVVLANCRRISMRRASLLRLRALSSRRWVAIARCARGDL